MTPNPKFRLQGLMLASFLFIADQAVKFIMIGPLALQSRRQIHIVSFFDLTWAENRGVSMGFLEANSDAQRWLLVALTALIAGVVAVWMWREKLRGDVLALAMVLGGALGNIVDRVRYGYVVDYADLHFGTFRPFWIFNLADACITIGVLILLARAFLIRERDDVHPASSGNGIAE
ncbi:MAG TPA: signal peptidase II [Sphingorhabdus sp.]|jgi:signal peptidase II|uniref:signal peptidase II n=1 Tax=Sphingorhabdus sp. TaxID=1902408 RepID=UPI002D07F2D3|nr:signal peptidase II [Sphingorhabdus sp.]HMT41520.1 signal peptidase II [Sphingorhabdus sp.]HMU20934.1 signal peptidase II [Sphingorhabdus sp.]